MIKLRDYQEEMVKHLLDHNSAGLFVDMGFGKTVATLVALEKMKEDNVLPTLLIAPIRVIKSVWRQEAEKWGIDLSFSLVHGKPKEREAALKKKADIYLINPENLVWLFDQKLPDFKILVIDESSLFKNVGSKRFKKLRYKVKNFDRRYILTGTPTPNSIGEIWTQMFILDKGERLGKTYGGFKSRYFEQVDYQGWVFQPREGAEEEIYSKVQDIILQQGGNLKGLPEFKFNKIIVDMDKEHKDFYQSMEEHSIASLDGEVLTSMNVVSALMKCRQISNGVFYNDDGEIVKLHDKKLEVLEEIVEETNSPVLIIYNFKHELEEIKSRLKKYKPVVLNEEDDAVERWNKGKIEVLLLHPASGGHGLNLQDGGHTMVWYGLTFSYEQFAQTIKRLHRSGQKHPVVCHLIMCRGTVDILMWAALQSKEQGQKKLLEALKEYKETPWLF